jgi:hypothetical protein
MYNKCTHQIRYAISKWRKLNPEPADWLCPGCGRVPPKYNHGFDVDHCHITKTFRGYLCNVPRVTGSVDDDPNTLMKLINLAMIMGKHKTEHGLPF